MWEESWTRNHGGGIMEEASWTRSLRNNREAPGRHPVGTHEAPRSTQVAAKRKPGSTKGTAGRHPGDTQGSRDLRKSEKVTILG